MNLSELSRVVPLTVHRDGEFRSLGLLCHADEKMLVQFYDGNYADQLCENPHISCVITVPQLVAQVPDHVSVAVCDDPSVAFYGIHHHLLDNTQFYWTDFDSEISPRAHIHETAFVAPRNVRIGRGTVVGPLAVISECTIIGEDVVVGAGSVIGGEGFEPKDVGGQHVLIRHAGGVRLHHRSAVLANSHVARAVFSGFTEVGEDTKIDALVHIAHNVRIGCRCELAASAFVGGSSTLGDNVWVGPHVVISSEIAIEDRAFVAIGAIVVRDVSQGQRVIGIPARPMLPPCE